MNENMLASTLHANTNHIELFQGNRWDFRGLRVIIKNASYHCSRVQIDKILG